MIIEEEKIIKPYTRLNHLGTTVRYNRTSTIYTIECDVCHRILTRSKGNCNRLSVGDKHACSPECVGILSHMGKIHEKLPRDRGGYIYVGNKRQHQIVVENIIGRPLYKTEIIHHINGDKGDNRASNLAVTTRSNHNKIHGQLEGLAFLLVQNGEINFCKKCEIYYLKNNKCSCELI